MSGGHVIRVYLIRHARAGDRKRWAGRDELRPLTKSGRRQADALTLRFRRVDIRRVVSSPYVRCAETVRQIATSRGLPLECSAALAEGAPAKESLSLVERVSDAPVVLCSHGDVVAAVVLALADRGMRLQEDHVWKKGSTWILERDGDSFTRGIYLPAPSG